MWVSSNSYFMLLICLVKKQNKLCCIIIYYFEFKLKWMMLLYNKNINIQCFHTSYPGVYQDKYENESSTKR